MMNWFHLSLALWCLGSIPTMAGIAEDQRLNYYRMTRYQKFVLYLFILALWPFAVAAAMVLVLHDRLSRAGR